VLEMLGGLAAASLVGLERARAEQQLQLQTERLERLTETTSDALIVTDRNMRLLAWNRGAEQMYGWLREEVLGQPLPFVPPNRRAAIQLLWQRVLNGGETVANYEDERLTKDGRLIPILATISPVRDARGSVAGVLGFAKDLSAFRVLEEQRKELGRFNERELIAMELHDNTMQALYGAVLSLGAADRLLDRDMQQAHAALQQVTGQLNTTIRDLRTYIFELQARRVRSGLSEGLAALADEARRTALVHVEVAVDESAERLMGPERVEQLLAVAREATFNVIRHAAASEMRLQIALEDRHIVLNVIDDGQGFDPDERLEPDEHIGLANMSERARRAGGRLRLQSQRGVGTSVQVTLPVADARE
jgi:PAS domain S-box-containing protein